MTNIEKAAQVILNTVNQAWQRGEILTTAGEAEHLAHELADAGLLQGVQPRPQQQQRDEPTSNLRRLAQTTTLDTIDEIDIALAAYRDDLASNYFPIAGDAGYWLWHPTNTEKRLAVALDNCGLGESEGYFCTRYERDGDKWVKGDTTELSLNEGDDIFDLLNHITTTLTEWAQEQKRSTK